MWKNLFYFSRKQRIGISILVIAILTTTVLNIFAPYLFTPKVQPSSNEFIAEALAFKANLEDREIHDKFAYKNRYDNNHWAQNKPTSFDKHSYVLSAFNPNTADSVTLVNLGIRPKIASNILKYRLKGGKFKSPSDLGKIYGISPDKLAELKPFMVIESGTKSNDTINGKQKVIENLCSVELNSADTTQLMKVKGIRRGMANGIVNFRRATGGFITVEQLTEIKGIKQDDFERIKQFCTVDTKLVSKIKINYVSAEKLSAHLYINFYQAKAMYELRRKKGRLKSWSELADTNEFTPEQLQKLKPYISFE